MKKYIIFGYGKFYIKECDIKEMCKSDHAYVEYTEENLDKIKKMGYKEV